MTKNEVVQATGCDEECMTVINSPTKNKVNCQFSELDTWCANREHSVCTVSRGDTAKIEESFCIPASCDNDVDRESIDFFNGDMTNNNNNNFLHRE